MREEPSLHRRNETRHERGQGECAVGASQGWRARAAPTQRDKCWCFAKPRRASSCCKPDMQVWCVSVLVYVCSLGTREWTILSHGHASASSQRTAPRLSTRRDAIWGQANAKKEENQRMVLKNGVVHTASAKHEETDTTARRAPLGQRPMNQRPQSTTSAPL